MKRILFFFLLLSFLSTHLLAQERKDSVTIRLETCSAAEIGIDDDMSSTNLLTKKVAIGKHKVIVRFGTTFQKEYDLNVEATGNHHYEFMINGKLDISTTPSGATIYVDGIAQGKSPLSLDILGDHNIRIEKDPETYYDASDRVSIKPFEHTARSYTLNKIPPRLYGMVLATASTSGDIGAILGICRRFGGYVRFAKGLQKGTIGDLDPYHSMGSLYNGPGLYKKDKHSYIAFTGGMMTRFHKNLYAYLGLGYAEYAQGYVPDDSWSFAPETIYPYGSKGCALDLGVIYKWKALLLSCGYTTILGKSYPSGNRHNEIYFGVGFSIHKNRK
jgi:hypothetical protein